MPRRSQSNLESLIFMPWWVSAAIGVLLFVLLSALRLSLATSGGVIGKGIAQGAGVFPVAVFVFFEFIALLSAIFRWKRGKRIESQTSLATINDLSWQEFEGLVSEAYRRKGFTVEQSFAGGADGGVDLVLRKDGQTTLVQCKRWRTAAVGAPVIREMYGLLVHEKANRVLVITSGYFTREAESFAKGKPMELIDGPQLLELVKEVQSQKTEITKTEGVGAAPVCPKCGSTMILRTAKRGANAGNSFYGCSTYPKCSGTRDAKSESA